MTRLKVYTSFDGDDMIYIDFMREFVIKNNYIPLNPTHALGYYLSTIEHKNSKILAMQDCCAVELLADEFWIFTHTDDLKLDLLPEGVLVEILTWLKSKDNYKFRVVNINKMLKSLRTIHTEKDYWGTSVEINTVKLKNSLSPDLYADIVKNANQILETIRDTVFIDTDTKNIKYIDWMKAAAFRNGLVPIVPQCVIPEPIYKLYNKELIYYQDVENIRTATSLTWKIVKNVDNIIPEDQKTVMKTLKEIGIPKYLKPDQWALTNKELLEIQNQ